MIPTATQAMKVMGRLVIAPTSAPVSASRSRSGERTWVRASDWPPPEARIAANPDSTPASVHATVEVRLTQTPESLAESAFSAMARIASPHGDHLTNAATPIAMRGAATSATISPGGNLIPSSTKDVLIGTGKGRLSRSEEHTSELQSLRHI